MTYFVIASTGGNIIALIGIGMIAIVDGAPGIMSSWIVFYSGLNFCSIAHIFVFSIQPKMLESQSGSAIRDNSHQSKTEEPQNLIGSTVTDTSARTEAEFEIDIEKDPKPAEKQLDKSEESEKPLEKSEENEKPLEKSDE